MQATPMPILQRQSPIDQALQVPTSVAFGPDGRIYVTEASRNRLTVYSVTGEKQRTLTDLSVPLGVAVGPTGTVYVSNAGRGRVDAFDADLNPLGTLGVGDGEFLRPIGLAVDRSGRVWVADAKRQQILVYGSDGIRHAAWPEPNAEVSLNHPTALAFDEAESEVFVVNRGTPEAPGKGDAIKVFDLDGVYLRSFGLLGGGDERVAQPVAIVLDEVGRVYVTDSLQNVVQLFDAQGGFVGTLYDKNHPLRRPLGIAIDRSSSLLSVASLGTKAIERYRLFKNPHTITATATGGGTVSPAGAVLVENGDGAVFRFDANEGFRLETVQLDGSDKVVSDGTLTLSAVTEDHTLTATFGKDPDIPVDSKIWTISASAGPGGSIGPSGAVRVADGADSHFTVVADPDYEVDVFSVDGTEVPLTAEGTFTLVDVRADHVVAAVFAASGAGDEADPSALFMVTTGAGENGSVRPSGDVFVTPGADLQITLLPDPGFRVDDVLVDDMSVGAVSEYTFEGVDRSHRLEARFTSVVGERFQRRDDGTIADVETGLLWSNNTRCGGALAWGEALTLAGAAGRGEVPDCLLPGAGWRLPNANELLSLTTDDLGQAPGNDVGGDDLAERLRLLGFDTVTADRYWSSTSRIGSEEMVWVVDLSSGALDSLQKTASAAVLLVRTVLSDEPTPWPTRTGQSRCYAVDGREVGCAGTGQDGETRAGAPWPVPRFEENADGTVTDRLTHLLWLQDTTCLGAGDAGLAAQTLAEFNLDPGQWACRGYSGTYSDWQLPGRNDLYGLMDFSEAGPDLPARHPFFAAFDVASPWSLEGSQPIRILQRAEGRASPDEGRLWLMRTEPAEPPPSETVDGSPSQGGTGQGSGGGACFLRCLIGGDG